MQNFLQFLLRNGTLWTFIVLELICLSIVIRYNRTQQQIFASSSSRFLGGIYERYDGFVDYIGLRKDAAELNAEIARLRTVIDEYNTLFSQEDLNLDSIETQPEFDYMAARIISKSVIGANNTLTINKGKQDGIDEHMGVISTNGIVGIVRQVSDHYAVVMSNFHSKSNVSAAIKNRNIHGSLVWEGLDVNYMSLKYIPNYINVSKGDTITTSGYSHIFPANIQIGLIDEKPEKVGDHYKIKVLLDSDLEDLEYVYVVKKINRLELNNLDTALDE